MCPNENVGVSESYSVSHLVGFESLIEMGDVVLDWGSSQFLCHTQILSARSTTLAHLVSIARSQQPAGVSRHLVIQITSSSSAPSFVVDTIQQANFLRYVYYDQCVIEDVAAAKELLHLADFFGIASMTCSIESWLCTHAAYNLQMPNITSIDKLIAMFEMGMDLRLTNLASLLLPWVVQRLNRGPLADAACPIWKEVQTRLTRLQNAMDSELKSIIMDMQWWSAGMPLRCDTCSCRSGDLALVIHPGYLAALSARSPTSVASQGVRLPESYLSVVAHMAHVLKEWKWGNTPVHTFCGVMRPY